MMVIALSSVCNYGMAQDPALGLTVTRMILLVLPKQYTVIDNE